MRNIMKYIDFAKTFKNRLLISIKDIKKAYPDFDKRRLYEWLKKGYILNISKGYYIFPEPKPDESRLFLIANKIRTPAYVSIETAFSYYQLIPENIFSITSVSTAKTLNIKSKIMNFIYRKISPKLFWGYDLIKSENYSFKMAKPEKALIDYFHLNPRLKSVSDFESLRINKEIFDRKIGKGNLREMLEKINQKSLNKRISDFMEYIKNA